MKANYPHPLLPNSRVCVCFEMQFSPYGKKICEGGGHFWDVGEWVVCVFWADTFNWL